MLGVAAAELGRRFILCDQNSEAIAMAKMRLAGWQFDCNGCEHIAAIRRARYSALVDVPASASGAQLEWR